MKTNKFISPFISCVVQNFPFIEESFDGLTQYQLLCKIVEKLNAVITQTNTQTENIEKLEEAFTTLKNYVDNYFNNLDVQTEINNKLDEMATSGELEEIIASYLNTQAVRGFSTLNDLKNATGLIAGAICQTSGKTTYKDGLGSLYRIRNITNEDTIDNDNLVAIVNDVSLVAEKITNNISNSKTTGTTSTYSCDYINSLDENFLDSSDIVNNLTSDDTSKALSAAMGKELRNLINIDRLINVDLSTIKYHCLCGVDSSCTSWIGGYGVLICIPLSLNSDYAVQIAFNNTTVRWRDSLSNGTYGDWKTFI